MYKLSRLLLIIGVALGFYAFAILAMLGWPWIPAAIGFIAVLVAAKQGRVYLTTLGSARWASERDLWRAGMIGASSGLILGRIPATSGSFAAFKNLLATRINAADACREFFLSMRRKRRGRLAQLPQAIHTAVFSPSGGGKGVSCVIPFLLTCSDCCVVVDFKGENAKLTAQHRRDAFGHTVVVLDPFKVVEPQPATWNPLDSIDRDSSVAIDECNDLAKALVIRSGSEHEPHWNDAAEAWIAAVLATVVRYGEREQGSRSLQTVSEILSDPKKLELALKLMGESDAWGGLLARMGGQLRHSVDKEKASTLTTVARHLRFLTSIAVSESTTKSTFDPNELRKGKLTVYLVLPPEHMGPQAALLRLWIGSLLRACIRGGLQEKNLVHFVLDESASLGHLQALDEAVDKFRAFGVRLQFYFQSMGQLKLCFPEGRDQTLLSNTSQVFFGVNESATAEFVSARLGESTIVVASGGNGTGTSNQASYSGQPQTSNSTSNNDNSNWQQQARKLLKPEEVIALPPRTAITFTPGVPPIRTTLLRYYEEKHLGKRPGWFIRSMTASFTLAGSALVLFVTLILAAAATAFITQPHKQSSSEAGVLPTQANVFRDQ